MRTLTQTNQLAIITVTTQRGTGINFVVTDVVAKFVIFLLASISLQVIISLVWQGSESATLYIQQWLIDLVFIWHAARGLERYGYG